MSCVESSQSKDTVNKSIILNYHDSIIRAIDIELLCGPFWLNDTIIGFYLEYLEREKYSNLNICFVRPEILQCVKFTEDAELDIFLEPLSFKEKSFALMPLNNCDVPDKMGGSHWSVLVYSKDESCCYHIDSMSGSNDVAAKNMSRILMSYLKIPHKMETIPSCQQGNSYDCGVYVIRYCEVILNHISEKGKIADLKLTEPFDVKKKRKQIRELIEYLAK